MFAYMNKFQLYCVTNVVMNYILSLNLEEKQPIFTQPYFETYKMFYYLFW